MAREAVKLNSPVSSPGQVGNRAAYMRPGSDRSGSKALAEALNSIGSSIKAASSQVDRFQAAQRQAQLEEAQRFQNQEVARQAAKGQRDAARGQTDKAAFLSDSPIYQAAYQEAHLETRMAKRMTDLETRVDWEQFNKDVENGHNAIQAFLLDQGEDIMGGYSNELQAKFFTRYRTWANAKIQDQAAGARAQRLINISDDSTENLRAILLTGGSPEEVIAHVEETANLLAAGGADAPSKSAVASLLVAAEAAGRTDVLDRLLENPEFTKAISADAEIDIQNKRDELRNKERREKAYEESQFNKAMDQAKGQAVLDMFLAADDDPTSIPAILDTFRASMLSMAASDPDSAPTYISLIQRYESALLPDPDKLDEMAPTERAIARIEAEERLRHLGARKDYDSPGFYEELADIFASTDARDHQTLTSALSSAAKAELPTDELRRMAERNKLVGTTLRTTFKELTRFSMHEPDANGISRFDRHFETKFLEYIDMGLGGPEAQRQAFGDAAQATGLYFDLATVVGNDKEAFARALTDPDLAGLIFENDAWRFFEAAKAERAAALQTQASRMLANLPPLSAGEATNTPEQ